MDVAQSRETTPPSSRLSNLQLTTCMLGIDPGLRRTGYAVARIDTPRRSILEVLGLGTIETERVTVKGLRKTNDDLRRAIIQASALRAIAQEHGVQAVAFEIATTTPYTYPTFSFGVMTGIAASLSLPIVALLPHEVKFAATGNARATKREVIRWALAKSAGSGIEWPTSNRANGLGLSYAGRHVTLAAEHPADALAAIQAALQSAEFGLAPANRRMSRPRSYSARQANCKTTSRMAD